MGLLFLFAPIQGYCRTEVSSSVPGVPATPGPTVCGQQSLVQAQAVWPMPFLAISVWSLAPLISYVGVRRRIAGQTDGAALILLALALEASVLASFGAAPFFAPFVLLPLVITTALALSARVEPRSA